MAKSSAKKKSAKPAKQAKRKPARAAKKPARSIVKKAAAKSAKKKPILKKMKSKKGPMKKPVSKKPVAKKPAAKKASVKKPVAKKAVKPVAKSTAKPMVRSVAKKPMKPVAIVKSTPAKAPAKGGRPTLAPMPIKMLPAGGGKLPPKRPKRPYKAVKLPAGYKPTDKEEYMSPQQTEYFRQKLLGWRKELIEESRETLDHLHEEDWHQADIADRASLETEAGVELRTRNRYLKLIAKIDSALRRIEDGEYGYCEETGEPIGLKRLEARPVATLSIDAQERHEKNERQYIDEE